MSWACASLVSAIGGRRCGGNWSRRSSAALRRPTASLLTGYVPRFAIDLIAREETEVLGSRWHVLGIEGGVPAAEALTNDIHVEIWKSAGGSGRVAGVHLDLWGWSTNKRLNELRGHTRSPRSRKFRRISPTRWCCSILHFIRITLAYENAAGAALLG